MLFGEVSENLAMGPVVGEELFSFEVLGEARSYLQSIMIRSIRLCHKNKC